MKRILIVLSLLMLMFTLNAGAAFAVEGAEPPPEGMMGITAVEEAPDLNSAPVSSDPNGNEVTTNDINASEKHQDDENPAALAADSAIAEQSVETTDLTSVAEEKKLLPGRITYVLAGAAVAVAGLIIVGQKRKRA